MVHIHAEGPAFFCWIPKLFGKRVICTIHGLDWDREKWRGSVASKFIRGGEKNAVKYADEIIVLSKDVQKYFLETYGRETHFIPNGVNRPEVREAKLITDHFGLEKDSYILFLGRLVPEKGIRYLVEAFKNVKTDKKLVIAGGSSDTDSFMEELKELAKGDDRILFTGFVQGAMLDELYSNAYIYTLPSDLEGMPLSLLEAMSYGNCCLVSDIPECTEVVEDKALIFKKSDVEDLQEKLQDACDHPEMVMKMKNQAADFICEKYNWDEVVKETMKLYVLEFGHLSRDKGTDTLLEVAKKMPNTEFVFIGYGPSADKMKDIPNVKYLGFKTGEELYRIIAEAAISVCPSEWYENCPYSVMPDKTFHYVASYMLKGYAMEKKGIAEKYRATSYKSLKRKISSLSDILDNAYGKSYCQISNPTLIGNVVNLGIANANKRKSRAITHSFGMKLRALMLGKEVEITFCDVQRTKKKYKFTDEERLSFVLFGILYASRCNNFHGNVAARMNSINANKDTFKMYTDMFLTEYIILAIHLNSQGALPDMVLNKVKENANLMV